MVGLTPDALYMGDEPGADRPGTRIAGEPRPAAKANAVQHLPVHVELALIAGRIADADRPGAVPPRKVVDLAFLDLAAAVHAIHHPHLVWRAPHGAQQPAQPCLRFFVEAGVQQGGEGEGGVAQPAITIVPVHRPIGLFRQAERGRGDDAAGRRICQRFERQQRTLHRFRPVRLPVEAGDPVPPSRQGLSERLFRVDRIGNWQLRRTVLQDVIGTFSRAERDASAQHILIAR